LPICPINISILLQICLQLPGLSGLTGCATMEGMTSKLSIRPAAATEIPALNQLITASARILSRGFYTAEETEAAITHVFGVDSELVADGTYLVVESGGDILGCGGWSKRATLFGGDGFAARASCLLDPARDAAKIRAFFVAPAAARRGVGAALLKACEDAARAAGFTRTELMATLPGEPFYAAHGYRRGDPISHDCGGVPVGFVPMHKQFSA
jgi:GNAT superfamily N-acetyltransferase